MYKSKFKFYLMIGFSLSTLFIYADAAQAVVPRRPCEPLDITGTWYMGNINANFKYDPANAWFFPYQIMVFGQDGSYKLWTSNKPPQGVDSAIIAAMPKTETYHFEGNGHLITTHNDTHQSTNYTCAIYTEENKGTHKGDIWLATGTPSGQLVIKVIEKENAVRANSTIGKP